MTRYATFPENGQTTSDNSIRHINKSPIEQQYISAHLTTIAHVCIISFTCFIIYLCFNDEFIFFTWHPLLFSIGWMCLMSEAVLMITKDNILTNGVPFKWRVRWHWMLQLTALSCTLIGFVVVVLNKEYKNKQHFKTYHGIFGLSSVICALIPTTLTGVPALFNVKLRNFIRPKINKVVHTTFGIASLLLGGVTMILSLYSNWFNKKIKKSGELFAICFIAVCFGIIWSLVRPMITYCKRLTAFRLFCSDCNK